MAEFCDRCFRTNARDGEVSHEGKCRRVLAEQYGKSSGPDHDDCAASSPVDDPPTSSQRRPPRRPSIELPRDERIDFEAADQRSEELVKFGPTSGAPAARINLARAYQKLRSEDIARRGDHANHPEAEDVRTLRSLVEYVRIHVRSEAYDLHAADGAMLRTEERLQIPRVKGFCIGETERAKADVFMAEHRTRHGSNEGAIGGRFTFSFTPTSIGEVVSVSCACGEKLDVTEYDSW